MALFGRHTTRPEGRHSTAAEVADPVRHAEWTVRLGSDWKLLDNRGAVLAVTNPDRSYSVRSADGYLLTQTDVVGAGLLIRDTRSRMIIADGRHTADGIVIGILPGGPANQRFVARALAPAVAEALTRSGPWRYRTIAADRGELRNRDGHLLADDLFTRAETGGRSDRWGGLTYWSVRVAENPFPTSWLFAVLLACEHLRR